LSARAAGLAAAVLAAFACGEAGPGRAGRDAPADLVFRNAAVYTMDAARSWARTVAVRGGRIVHAGGDSLPAGLVGRETEVVDLAGEMLLPGFQDGHVHLLLGGVELGECTLFTLETAAAVLDPIAACAKARPDGWLRGVGWELPVFPNANPSKAQLDRIAPDRPALLEAADGHSAWANSRALELAGITRDTPDPPDGRIEKDPRTGEPSGTLRETAMDLVSDLLPERTDGELAAGLGRALPLAAERGLTTVMEASASEGLLRAYAAADRAGRLTLRVVVAADGGPDSTGVEGVVRRLGEWRTRYTIPRWTAWRPPWIETAGRCTSMPSATVRSA
jgi:predicted amidohydrolase YtcJ